MALAMMMTIHGSAAHGAEPPDKHSSAPVKWIVYYSDKLPAGTFLPYDVIVFDDAAHPDLSPLLYRNKTLLAYLSLAEIRSDKPYLQQMEKDGMLLGKNAIWNSRHIDVRKPEWTRFVIEEIIPPLIQKGFNGLMLDTVDTAIAMEAEDAKKYAGMREAAVRLIKEIRYQYPNLKIMLNRGFEILPQVENDIDMLLAESIYIKYDFKEKTFERFPDTVYTGLAAYFNEAKKRNPALRIYTLDYWKKDDPAGMLAIYDAQAANGFSPYVSTSLDLDLAEEKPQ